MADQQYCLRWNNHQTTLVSIFDTLLQRDRFTDCTISAEGQSLAAHKILLTACSPYFEAVLSQIRYDRHPVIILKDVTFAELKALMDYMYRGEVNISQDQLAALLKVAESLQIKGLSDSGEKEKPEKRPPPLPQQPAPSVPRSSGLTVEHSRRSNQAQILDLPLDSPLNRHDGNVSPVPRKRKRPRRRSSGDDSSLGQVHPTSMTESLDSSNSREPIAASIPQNVSALLSKTAVIPEPRLHDHDLVLPDALANVDIPKIEPPTELDLLQPKEEYVDDNDDVDHITLDDDDDDMDLSQQAGPSHGGEGSSSQGYPPSWHQASDRSNDEVFMAAQEAVGGAQRDSQAAAPLRVLTAQVKHESDSVPQRVKVLYTFFPGGGGALSLASNANCSVETSSFGLESSDEVSTSNSNVLSEENRSTLDDGSTECGISAVSDLDRLRDLANPTNAEAAKFMRLARVPVVVVHKLKLPLGNEGTNVVGLKVEGVGDSCQSTDSVFVRDHSTNRSQYADIRDIATNLAECYYSEVSNQSIPVPSNSLGSNCSYPSSTGIEFTMPESKSSNNSSRRAFKDIAKRGKRKPTSTPKKKFINILPKPHDNIADILPQTNSQAKSSITLLSNLSVPQSTPSVGSISNQSPMDTGCFIQRYSRLAVPQPVECVPFMSNLTANHTVNMETNSSIQNYPSLPAQQAMECVPYISNFASHHSSPMETNTSIQHYSGMPVQQPLDCVPFVSDLSNHVDVIGSTQNFAISTQSRDFDNRTVSNTFQPITLSGNNFPALFDFLGKCNLGQGSMVMKKCSAASASTLPTAPATRKYVNILPRPDASVGVAPAPGPGGRNKPTPLGVRKTHVRNRRLARVVTCVTCAKTFGSNYELYSHLVTHLPHMPNSGR